MASNAAADSPNGVSGIYGGTGQSNLNSNYVEGTPVSSNAAHGGGTAAANTVSDRAGATAPVNRKPLPTLPSKLPALSVVESACRTLALDTAGALFHREEAGAAWLSVPTQWQGHALTLHLSQPSSAAQPAAGTNTACAAVARQQKQALASPVPAFELTTDSGVIYNQLKRPDLEVLQRGPAVAIGDVQEVACFVPPVLVAGPPVRASLCLPQSTSGKSGCP